MTIAVTAVAQPVSPFDYGLREATSGMGRYFALYNTEKLRTREDWSPEMEYYVNYVKSGKGKASDCIACKKCERVCPQHIPISDWMKQVKVTLEDENYML